MRNQWKCQPRNLVSIEIALKPNKEQLCAKVNDIQIVCIFCLKVHKNQFYSNQNEKLPKSIEICFVFQWRILIIESQWRHTIHSIRLLSMPWWMR